MLRLRTLSLRLALLLGFLLAPSIASSASGPVFPPDPVPEDAPTAAPRPDLRPRAYQEASFAPQPSGGPDLFGYTWDATTAYNWVDISASGKKVTDFTSQVAIGFSFPFYENAYSKVLISPDGYLTFDSASYIETPINTDLPHDAHPNGMIAPFWDDLGISSQAGSGVFTASLADRFVTEWRQVEKSSTGDIFTFQAILFQNGDIKFQYKTLSGTLNQATVGLEDGDGLDGLRYLYNASGLSSGKAVRFARPGASARVKLMSHYSSGFVINDIFRTNLVIRNTGEKGTDTFNLAAKQVSASPGVSWTLKFYDSTGNALLKDTNNDGKVETGPVSQGETVTVVIKVIANNAQPGDYSRFEVSASSGIASSRLDTLLLQAAVPASFAQAYIDKDGQGLDLIWQANRLNTHVDSWYSGSSEAMNLFPGRRYLYVWEKNEIDAASYTQPYRDLEFAVVNRTGYVERKRAKLTSNKDDVTDVLSVADGSPDMALSPSEDTAVLWIRRKTNFSTNQVNFNAFLSILDQRGEVLLGEQNLTKSSSWLNPSLTGYLKPTVAATDDGRFVLGWLEEFSTSGGDQREINLAIYGENGNEILGAQRLPAVNLNGWMYDDLSLIPLTGNRVLLVYSLSLRETDNWSYQIGYRVLNSQGKVIVPHKTVPGAAGWRPDAIQLPGGSVIIGWTDANSEGVAYAILDGQSLNLSSGPTSLSTPNARPGSFVSITTDDTGNGILTWEDSRWNGYLYYALIGPNGEAITPPMVFASGADDLFIITSETGQGNAPYDGHWYVFLPHASR